MRIRFTLDITRTPKPEPTDTDTDPPFVQDNGYAHIERNPEYFQTGFTVQPDYDDRR
jgi:hypothetical protein